ncbi:tumor necrosis factor receptor superfamily member 14 isoform X2 [Sinocyclocheilus anshuiensis]|uniref:Tumor necrosis factor receptor superfamily member 14-like n=1 Tax=Sinocyclocheilus anshuiensis TaxID=1608454 RepID=A0A671K5U6_9TELE|nr:PREDICTED: tumor necrosis factor receptor superfamily member 14-like isoform X2 [Sinocyclocheilus anshuiensis]XP_016350621.1 PREDICTED: tumor necrosis factor receptor superfamily member 14-like isoform X2 [Sinocyclocheilus anshuiensis]XP_016350622.1 PREDICTED: tumor necrosis factor receptor superfamily member 14-like isoform X2 [Sinocyclocheilus anshuiensis]
MDMLLLRTIISTIAVIIATNFELCFCGCARAEYDINGECCPMCAPGNRVYWHCTIDTSTTCVPCPASTYTDESNGLTKCFSCTVCDTVQQLKVKKACTRSADTICEPKEGFHCIKLNKDSCALAVEHTECKPGQYIKQTGTAFTDTVCAGCTDGTYSNGSLMACLPHSKCETMGLTEIKAGTTSSDAECEKVTSVGLIVGVTITVLVAVAVTLLACITYRKHKARHSNKSVCYTPQQATEDDESKWPTQLDLL